MIEAKQVQVRYGERVVVDDFSLSVQAGEVVALMGPNGCGKTSSLHALSGYVSPAQGEVSLLGKPLREYRAAERAARMAFLAQRGEVSLPLTVAEWVQMGAYVGQAERVSLEACLQRFDLQALREQRISELSGGEWQRVQMAQALWRRPQVLLLDEPSNHLDLRYQDELAGWIRDFVAAGEGCCVCVLHDMAWAAQLCTRVVLMRAGRICYQGRPQECLSPERVSEVFGVSPECLRARGLPV